MTKNDPNPYTLIGGPASGLTVQVDNESRFVMLAGEYAGHVYRCLRQPGGPTQFVYSGAGDVDENLLGARWRLIVHLVAEAFRDRRRDPEAVLQADPYARKLSASLAGTPDGPSLTRHYSVSEIVGGDLDVLASQFFEEYCDRESSREA